MTYTYIVNPETGEILFDLIHDLITQNIRAIKLIAKKLKCGAPLERLTAMLGFKTKEESAILADHNNTVRDIKEMMALIDQMSTTIATQAQMIDTRDQLLDEAYLKLESAETELIIRRKNDEFRQKLTVAK